VRFQTLARHSNRQAIDWSEFRFMALAIEPTAGL
jgi:hypothetical protein